MAVCLPASPPAPSQLSRRTTVILNQPGPRIYSSGLSSSKGFSATWPPPPPQGPPVSWLILPRWQGLLRPFWRSPVVCRPSCAQRRAGLCPGPSPPLLCGFCLSLLSSRGKAAVEDRPGRAHGVFAADARLTSSSVGSRGGGPHTGIPLGHRWVVQSLSRV